MLTRIEGLDPVAGTLEQLWLSYNQIMKLTGMECLTKLRVLYLANNQIKDYKELDSVPQTVEARARGCCCLQATCADAQRTPPPQLTPQELSLVGNPLHDAAKADGPPAALGSTYRIEILRKLPNLKKIDGVTVDPDERDTARNKTAGGGGTKPFTPGTAPNTAAPGTAKSAGGGGLGDTQPPPGEPVAA